MNQIKQKSLSEYPTSFSRKGKLWVTILTRGILFSLVWWILTDGEVSSWWIGGPTVVLALIVSVALIPPVYLSWRAVLRFVPFFLTRSLMGAIDVAWRAFHPRLPITPDLIEYPLKIPVGLPQVVMANTVSLLPGTLSAELNKNVLKVHVLDNGNDFKTELSVIEQHVERMFDLSRNNMN